MRTLILAIAGIFLSGGLVAFAQPPGGAGQPAPQPAPMQRPGMPPEINGPGSPGYNPGPGTASERVNDNEFAKKAAEGGMAEVELGKLAAQKGSTPAVKQFGERMVDDHTKANDELKQIASKENIDLPTSLNKKDRKEMNELAKLSGPAFDKAYIRNQVRDHRNDVREFQREAQGGSNAVLKQYAANTLPTLQQHLSLAQNLKKTAQ